MNPETVENVRTMVSSIAELIAWMSITGAFWWWNVHTVRNILTYRRWKCDADKEDVEDFTNGKAAALPQFATAALFSKCDKPDRARFAYDLLLGRDATRRWDTLMFITMGAALGGSAFIVTVRLLPATDPGQLFLPVVTTSLGILIAKGMASLSIKGAQFFLKDRLAVAAGAVAEMLDVDNRSSLSGLVLFSTCAKTLHNAKNALKKTWIPTSGIRCKKLEYRSQKKWERAEKMVITRLARAYSGDYVGRMAERQRRWTRDATETTKFIAGLAVSLVSAIAVWVS
ncbi:MAG: hypothetical protein FWF02_10190 [Micrococcales bacterium]|nr:hypothetical protein [Micrococcales bacterium]MCL2668055.1 hypothetical protein [Micrococcales bacterium]